MLLRTITILIFAISPIMAFTQENPSTKKYSITDYPEGFYLTLEDFLDKKNSPLREIAKESIDTRERIQDDKVVDQFFFITLPDTAKLKKVFAVSYKGNLYIRQIYFYKYAAKGDKTYSGYNPNSYHRVLNDGNFLYLEGDFINGWKQGTSSQFGLIGGIANAALSSNAKPTKAVIFNFETKQFDMIRNCEDLNNFLASRNSTNKIECDKRYTPIEVVRDYIFEEIKK